MASGIAVTVDGNFLFGAAAFTVAVGGFLAQWRLGKKTDAMSEQLAQASLDNLAATADVKKEVVTGNEQTLGQLGMRTETRRAEDIPSGDRTAEEQRHIDADPQHKE